MVYRSLIRGQNEKFLWNTKNGMMSVASGVVAIGMGGQGIGCLRELKKEVAAQIDPQSDGKGNSVFPGVRFLAVDTVENALQFAEPLNEKEFFNLWTNPSFLKNSALRKSRPDLAWLPEIPVLLGAPISGTAGNRQLGRCMFMLKSRVFLERITELIQQVVREKETSKGLQIHIFTGLGGGTGSGIFLDVCYMVQHVLRQMGIFENAEVFLYCLMPDIVLSKLNSGSNSAARSAIQANSYAAMKELNHCIRMWKVGGRWEQKYDSFQIQTDAPMVTMCYLVSAYSADRTFHPVLNVWETVAEYVFYRRMAEIPEQRFANPYSWDGFLPLKALQEDSCYGTFGVAKLPDLSEDAVTYLIARDLQRMAQRARKKPNEDELQHFMSRCGLTKGALYRTLLQETRDQAPVLEKDYKLFLKMVEEDLEKPDQLLLPAEFADFYRQAEEEMLQRVQANRQALEKEWNPEKMGQDGRFSGICRLHCELLDLIRRPEFGPFYAAELLNRKDGPDAITVLRGSLEETREYMRKYELDLVRFRDEIKQRRAAFLHPTLLQLGKRATLFAEFTEAIRRYFTVEYQIAILRELEKTILFLTSQLKQFYENKMRPYIQTLLNLEETAQYMEGGVCSARFDNEIALLSAEEFKAWLDEEFPASEEKENDLYEDLFENPQFWQTGDESKLTKHIRERYQYEFPDCERISLSDVLRCRFQTEDTQELQYRAGREFFQPLLEKASPLFPTFLKGKYSEMFCRVEMKNGNSPLGHEMQDQMNRWNFSKKIVSFSLVNYAMQALHSVYGISMAEYVGVEDCMKSYRAGNGMGVHLYEGTPEDARNWRNLPDLI